MDQDKYASRYMHLLRHDEQEQSKQQWIVFESNSQPFRCPNIPCICEHIAMCNLLKHSIHFQKQIRSFLKRTQEPSNRTEVRTLKTIINPRYVLKEWYKTKIWLRRAIACEGFILKELYKTTIAITRDYSATKSKSQAIAPNFDLKKGGRR